MDEQPAPPETTTQLDDALTPDPAPRVIYPPPPNVPWTVLFGAQIVIAILAIILAPRPWWNLVSNLAFDAWAVYLCLWLRRLNPDSMSIFCCAAAIAPQIAFAVPTGPQTMTPGAAIFAGALALLGLLLWIVTIYVVRADLHFQYNIREPIGLYLSGIMTFFFSFLYFQYHLYKIAQLRERWGDRPFYYQGGPPLP